VGTRITTEVVESYLNCKVKAYLKLNGHPGTRSEYEEFLLQNRQLVRQQAISKIIAKTSKDKIATDIPLSTPSLQVGCSYVLDPILDDQPWLLRFDGLRRVDGTSNLGDFHYVPMLFHEGRGVGKAQKHLVELYGWLLSRVQGRHPATGMIWHGQECRASEVRLNPDTRRCERFWQELVVMTSLTAPPSLVLNDHCQVCEFRHRCHDQAVQEDNLSLLRGMGEKEVKRNGRKGIFTVRQLSYAFRPRRRPKWARAAPRPHSFALQALALRENKVYINGTPELRRTPVRVYLDIEGVPEENFYYLIGVLIDDGATQEFHSFWADSNEEQGCLAAQLVQRLFALSDYTVYHFGNYESKALKSLKSNAPEELRQPLAEIQKRTVNVLSVVHTAIYVPTFSNTLKNVAGFLGFQWSDAGATGLDSILWRSQWERTRNEELKARLLRYNQEDCLALKAVTDFIMSFVGDGIHAASDRELPMPDVVHTSDLQEASPRNHRFGVISFVLPELDFVNKCAYFNYQREKVFVRTNKAIKGTRRFNRTGRGKAPKPNALVEILAKSCPACGDKRLAERRKASRVVIDLKFFNKGVKRWVTKYVSATYQCTHCGECFLPDAYPTSKEKHGHGLKCWFAYQHVIGGQNTMKITSGIKEIFGLTVPSAYHRFKNSLVQHYQATYEALLQSILTGSLLHIDETEVIMKGKAEKGCVWVVTNMEAVYFFYKESRKAAFLEEMLQGFSGVVVSDFFTAYDTLKCPQQKCVIHLLRDVNDDLLRSPFDQELRNVVQPFATLFRTIIGTVDKYGLKRRHLRKHKRQADDFLQSVREMKLESDYAVKHQERFAKYGDRLFTFLDYDGVPWNNNNAEHAIKRFVKYRRDADGRFTEKSLGDHLVLLSVLVTCEFKNLPVLRFVLSQATELSRSSMKQAERLLSKSRLR
jgi:predicted RecB family nuclease